MIERAGPVTWPFSGGVLRVAEINRAWLFRELRHSLFLLVADGDTALAGVPDGCCKPDDPALDFDNFQDAVVGNYGPELPPKLEVALADVKSAFGFVIGDGWSDEAVRSAPEWAVVRERAGVALGLPDLV